jgi:hypothetical protein
VQWQSRYHPHPGTKEHGGAGWAHGGDVNAIETGVSHDEIARRAYEIWQSRGCPAGDGSEDWQAAKAELIADRVARNGSTHERMQSWWSRVRQRITGRAGA